MVTFKLHSSARESGEAYWVVEKIAEGVLQLVRILNPLADPANRRRKHRYILELLDDEPELRARYLERVTALTIDEYGFVVDEWRTRWSNSIISIAKAIGGSGSADLENVQRFL